MFELPGSQLCLPSTTKPMFLKGFPVEAKNDYDSKFVPLLSLPGSQTVVSEPCAFCSIFMFVTVVRKMLFVSVCCKGNLVLNVTEEFSDVEPEDCVREDVKIAWVADALGCLRTCLSRGREGGCCSGRAWQECVERPGASTLFLGPLRHLLCRLETKLFGITSCHTGFTSDILKVLDDLYTISVLFKSGQLKLSSTVCF